MKSQVTVADLDDLVNQLFEIREKKEALEKQVKDMNEQYRVVEHKVLAHLADADKNNYGTSLGKIIKQTRYSVSMPKDLEKKKAFFGWLRDQNVFEDLVTVNHQTLNSLYKDQMAIAVENKDPDFQIPGLGEPTSMEFLQLRRTK